MAKKKIKKVFLPKWQRIFLIPLFVGLWLMITYMEFFGPENSDKLGIGGYLFFSAIMLGTAIMMYLMTTGKLPAYIIEEEDKE